MESPALHLRGLSHGATPSSAPASGDCARASDGTWLLCALCAHPLARVSAAIPVGGAHAHTFANPHGHVHRIALYSEAPGCLVLSGASSEFSWFAGHVWEIVLCARCREHTGWHFTGPSTFFGLRIDRLVPER